MEFYDNFVKMCNKIGKKPSKVAVEIGISKSIVSRWKSGGGVTDATAQKVAEYFDVPISELVGEHVEAKKESPPQSGELMYPDWYKKLTLEEVEQVRNYAYFLISERRKGQP